MCVKFVRNAYEKVDLLKDNSWKKYTILVVAVPYTEKSHELVKRWSKIPKIKKTGIGFMLVKEDVMIGCDRW